MLLCSALCCSQLRHLGSVERGPDLCWSPLIGEGRLHHLFFVLSFLVCFPGFWLSTGGLCGQGLSAALTAPSSPSTKSHSYGRVLCTANRAERKHADKAPLLMCGETTGNHSQYMGTLAGIWHLIPPLMILCCANLEVGLQIGKPAPCIVYKAVCIIMHTTSDIAHNGANYVSS